MAGEPCDVCGMVPWIRIKSGQFLCVSCETTNFGFPNTVSKDFLPDYGNVSRNRLKEMERRVMLPDHDKSGGYFVGRRMENGKIADKTPNYKP